MQQAKLLAAIVQAAAGNKSEQTPHGWCHRGHDEGPALGQLSTAGMIKLGQESSHGIPVMVTDAAIQYLASQSQTQVQPAPPMQQPVQNQPHHVQIDMHIPLPEPSRRGFQRGEGGTVLERWGFDTIPVRGSFFVPQSQSNDPAMPVHRSFSSAVSQANTKLWPKHFMIREVDETAHGGGKGARVWRGDDLTGDRPAPKPRKSKKAAQAEQAQMQPAPAYQQPGYPMPGGYPAPQAPQPGVIGHNAQAGHYMPPPPPGGYQAPPQGPAGGFGGGGFAPPGYAPPSFTAPDE